MFAQGSAALDGGWLERVEELLHIWREIKFCFDLSEPRITIRTSTTRASATEVILQAVLCNLHADLFGPSCEELFVVWSEGIGEREREINLSKTMCGSISVGAPSRKHIISLGKEFQRGYRIDNDWARF